MKTVNWRIEGMHCEGCAETIKGLLDVQPGVVESAVSFEEARARVLFDAAVIDEQKLAAAVERAGFKVSAAA